MGSQRRLGRDRREGLLICPPEQRRDAELWTQDVRIEGGHEYSQPFTFTMGPNEVNTVRRCDIYVYRWDQPPRFVEYPGSSDHSQSNLWNPTELMFITGTNKRYPGFETLCSVEADLRAPYLAAPFQNGQNGKRYKSVNVSVLDLGQSARCSWSAVPLVPGVRSDRADRTLALDRKGMSGTVYFG
jgi:hypothetical protein